MYMQVTSERKKYIDKLNGGYDQIILLYIYIYIYEMTSCNITLYKRPMINQNLQNIWSLIRNNQRRYH